MTPVTWGLFGAVCGIVITLVVVGKSLARGGRAIIFVGFLTALAALAALVLFQGRTRSHMWPPDVSHLVQFHGLPAPMPQVKVSVPVDVHVADEQDRITPEHAALDHDTIEHAIEAAKTAAAIAQDSGSETTITHDDGIRITAHAKPREPKPTSAATKAKRFKQRVERSVNRGMRQIQSPSVKRIIKLVLPAFVIASFLCIGYLLLDGATRGQLSWPLRIIAVILFGVLFATVAALK